MRQRWHYRIRRIRAKRPLIRAAVMSVMMAAAFLLFAGKGEMRLHILSDCSRQYGIRVAEVILESCFPEVSEKKYAFAVDRQIPLLAWLSEAGGTEAPEKPSGIAKRLEAPAGNTGGTENSEKPSGIVQKSEASAGNTGGTESTESTETPSGKAQEENRSPVDTAGFECASSGLQEAGRLGTGGIIMEKLADHDYVMKNFYEVHTNTTADRELINAEKFLKAELMLEKNEDEPQILIYHTHSQEEYADHLQNPEAVITGVGSYLQELLTARGYNVIHDTNVYDLRDGKLDRSRAYTYALDGINGILQDNPSIKVVLDIHRDGVPEGMHLVKEINGKPTAQIMFFNGLSQTPEGPIEYLPNPNREANLAFSFRLQLLAKRKYPGFTRKIYLKGLRYNQHVRARTALIEVGAQTNTFEEAKNAMEPLADILDQVLRGYDR
mgnify:CR=1 FL=1